MTLPNEILDRIHYIASDKFPSSDIAREVFIEGAVTLWLTLVEDEIDSQERSDEQET